MKRENNAESVILGKAREGKCLAWAIMGYYAYCTVASFNDSFVNRGQEFCWLDLDTANIDTIPESFFSNEKVEKLQIYPGNRLIISASIRKLRACWEIL